MTSDQRSMPFVYRHLSGRPRENETQIVMSKAQVTRCSVKLDAYKSLVDFTIPSGLCFWGWCHSRAKGMMQTGMESA